MKVPSRFRLLWLVVAVGLLLYANSKYRDAALVGYLWLLLWTFPVGPVFFIAQLYGLPPLGPFLPNYFEQSGIVLLAYGFNFWIVPLIRARVVWHSGSGKPQDDAGHRGGGSP